MCGSRFSGGRAGERESARDIDSIFAEGTLIDEALRQAAREAIRRHRQMGLPLAVYRDGRIVWISAEALEAEDGDEAVERGKAQVGF